jgi:hypothetical protein
MDTLAKLNAPARQQNQIEEEGHKYFYRREGRLRQLYYVYSYTLPSFDADRL